MKKLLKPMMSAPFWLLKRTKVGKKSLFFKMALKGLTEQEKIELGKSVVLNRMIGNVAGYRFKLVTLLNSLLNETTLAQKYVSNLCENLHLYESQVGQDCLVDTLLLHKEKGVFIEIGVGDGKFISNTYFLEKYRGWTGLLCEPSLKFRESINKTRTAQLVAQAVYDKSGVELNFMEVEGAEELSTLSTFRTGDAHDRTHVKEYKVTTISFDDLYKNYLPGKMIDYLSIDTEGSELSILSGIDFEHIDVSIISVEHSYNTEKLEQISLLLGKHNYVEILPGIFEFDCIFVKKSVLDNYTSKVIL